jgi:hypothetical protein
LGADLAEFENESSPVTALLAVADLTTGPDGEDLTLDGRIAEVMARYGADHVVSRSWIMAFEDAQRLFARADAITSDSAGRPDPLVAYDRRRVGLWPGGCRGPSR